MIKKKSYAIEEMMSDDWIERWSGFKSLAKARDYARWASTTGCGRLRIVRVTREPVYRQKP